MEPYQKYSGGTGLGAEVGVGGGEKVDLCQELNMLGRKKRHIIYNVASSERQIFLRNLQMHHTYLASQRDWSKAGSWHVFELCAFDQNHKLRQT